MKKKVCFISVYFGTIPSFFDVFLKSCSWNENFQWLIFHDSPIPYEVPSNVKSICISVEKFLELINQKLNLNIKEIRYYKVCDFRPAFGLIFEDYLKKYDFWGICDTDLILGCLDNFINDELLMEYDKIFTMGHLSLIRNTSQCNELFKVNTVNSENYLKVFMDSKNYIYDEFNGFTEKFIDTQKKVFKEKICADIGSFKKRITVITKWFFRLIQPQNNFAQYCTDKNYRYQLFILNHGKIKKVYIKKGCVCQKEYAYIHKLEFSTKYNFDKDTDLIITQKGYVKDEEIFKKINMDTLRKSDINKYNKTSNIFEWFEKIYWTILWSYRNIKNGVKKQLKK